MKLLLSVLLAAASQDVSIESLMRGWRFEDPAVREAATDIILSRWQAWPEADLAKVAKVAREGSPEASALATFVLSRIRVRRSLGLEALKTLPGIDGILDGGNEEQRYEQIRTAIELWSEGALGGAAGGRIAQAARKGPWRLRAVDIVVLCRDQEAKPFGPILASFLTHPLREVRSNAADAIGFLGLKEFAGDLVPLLADEEGDLHWEIASALEVLGARNHAPRIAVFLRHPSSGVRSAAAITLGWLDAREFAPAIGNLLKDSHREVRLHAVEALGYLEARDFAVQIWKFLRDEDAYARRTSVEALGRMREESHAPILAGLIEDPDRTVRVAAVTALANLGEKGHRQLLERVIQAGDDFKEQQRVVDELMRTRDPDLVKRLRKTFVAEEILTTREALRDSLRKAGFHLIAPAGGTMRDSILKGSTLTVSQALGKAFVHPDVVVPDGDRILVLTPSAALEHWRKKLDGK